MFGLGSAQFAGWPLVTQYKLDTAPVPPQHTLARNAARRFSCASARSRQVCAASARLTRLRLCAGGEGKRPSGQQRVEAIPAPARQLFARLWPNIVAIRPLSRGLGKRKCCHGSNTAKRLAGWSRLTPRPLSATVATKPTSRRAGRRTILGPPFATIGTYAAKAGRGKMGPCSTGCAAGAKDQTPGIKSQCASRRPRLTRSRNCSA